MKMKLTSLGIGDWFVAGATLYISFSPAPSWVKLLFWCVTLRDNLKITINYQSLKQTKAPETGGPCCLSYWFG